MNIRQGLIVFNAALIGVFFIMHVNFLMLIGLGYITMEAYIGAKGKNFENKD